MQLGTLLPLGDIGGDPSVVRDYAQGLEAMGIDFLEAPDHVLGVNAASRPDWDLSRNTSADLFHDPFVLFGFLAGCTAKLGFSTGVLILPQRQTVLVAKQAACLDVLCGGKFRLGIGVGWNEVEFIGLNEDFHTRGRRSAEQVQVMQALWAEPHVTFKGRWHTIDDAGINPRPASGRVPVWFGGHHEQTLKRIAKYGDGWMPNALSAGRHRAADPRDVADPDARGGARSSFDRHRGVDLVRRGQRRGMAQGGGVLEGGGRLAYLPDHDVQPAPPSPHRRAHAGRSPGGGEALSRGDRRHVVGGASDATWCVTAAG